MDMHQPEASSSTAPPPAVHQATLVFDSGLSRERFAELIETNGIVHKLVLRLMEKCGGETSLRIGLVITAQDAAYPDPRALHSVIPAYRQDFRRPSALLTSLPSIVSRFSPQAALNRGKPGSLLSDIWDIEDGAGLSISSSEPGPSDYFLNGLVAAIELLEHHSLPNTIPPPGALQSLSPLSALPMLSMIYKPHVRETQQSHLIVFTEKASLAAMDSDTRGSQTWARGDSCAVYDDVDWSTIGERCKAKDIACSCVIVGSGELRRGSTSLGRDGAASAEKLRKMCQESTGSGDSQDEPWFPLPPDSDVYLTGFALKPIMSPPAPEPPVAAVDVKPTTNAPPGTENMTEAQIKYQLAQKQAMQLKMSQAAQQAGPGQGGTFNVLANLLASGRLDPNVMAQLVANVRSEDPAVRQKAVQQLTSLMSLQKQSQAAQSGGVNTSAQGSAAPNAANYTQQQQQFMAVMQQRAQAAQAQVAAAQQANKSAAEPGKSSAPPSATSTTAPQPPQPTTQPQATAQQLAQQQLLLQQQRAAQMASQQNLGAANAAGTAAAPSAPPAAAAAPTTTAPRPSPQTVWAGSISWTMKGADNQPQKWVIPVDCMLLSTGTDAAQLQTSVWPQNLEMTGMSQMNMNELQTYVKANQAPCVLFTVSAEADNSAKSKMAYLTMTLGSKNLCAFIRFGGPGFGILLISSNQPSTSSEKMYRLLGVVCLKVPFNFGSNAGAPAGAAQPNANANAQQAQPQPQPAAVAPQPATNPPIRPMMLNINGPNTSTPIPSSSLPNANMLQQAQLQSQLMHQQQSQNSQQGQNQPPQQGTPQGHARTPSQNLGTPHSQGLQTPQQAQQPRLPSNPQAPPSTLQQFASQPNVNTIQQLQLRQLQAQAQQSGFQNQNQQASGPPQVQPQQPLQQQQQQPQQQQQQPPQPGQAPGQPAAPIPFTPQQRAGIIKLLRDAGMNVPDTFDPNVIPRETLIAFMQNARQKQQQAQQAAAAAVGAPGVGGPGGANIGGAVGGGVGGVQPGNPGAAAAGMNTMKLNNFMLNNGGLSINGAPNFAAQQPQQQQAGGAGPGLAPGGLGGLQLGQFNQLQQFQQAQAAQAQAAAGNAGGPGVAGGGGAGGAGAASALGLFAAQQGLSLPQFQQQVGLGQFQQH